jgi:type I restriction enzyme S subunit
MKDWELVSLDNVCKLINGRAYKQEELLKEGKYPVLRVGNFFSNRSWYYSNLELDDSKYCNDGDLLYAWSASFGPRIWQGGKVIYHYHIWKTELDQSRVFKRFLYYWFEWDTERIKAEQGVGTTMIHVTKGAMEERTLYIPPLPEQKRIVAILDEAFEGIDSAIANTEKNLANTREIFESYLNTIFTQKGDGWVEKKLGDTCIVERGSSPRPIQKFFTDSSDGVNWIKIGDTKGVNKYIYSTNQKITTEGAKQSRRVELGDFILTNSMSYGKPYIMATTGYIHDGWFVLRLAEDIINKDFFYYLLGSNLVQEQFKILAAGAIVKNISGDLVKRAVLPIPPISQQKAMVEVIEKLATETQRLETIYRQKLAALKELKQSILQKAFTGELTADTSKTVKEKIAA